MMTDASFSSDDSDQWLDAFEQRWIAESSPPDIISECQRLRGQASFEDGRVVWELAMTDLEFRWRDPRHQLRRGTRWYAENLTPYGLRPEEIEDLALHELIVRSRWGDRPPIGDLLAEQFGEHASVDGSIFHDRWRRQLEQKFPIVCSVIVGLHHQYETHLHTPCVIGRQRSSDPQAPGWCRDPRADRTRLVIAARTENSVSREQLMVTRVAVDTLQVTPLSTNVTVFAGDRALQPNEPVLLTLGRLGLDLRFGRLVLRLNRRP